MEILAFELGPFATNAYLLLPPGSSEAVLVDAPPGAAKIVREQLAEHNRQLTALLLTHGHWDHMADAAEVRALGAKVYAHPGDREWIENPIVQARMLGPQFAYRPCVVDHWLRAGETLELPGLRFEVRHVPGHAPGSVLFYSAALAAAFSGDAIFAGAVGRTDLPGGDWSELEQSILSQVYTLPPETVLYPGHGPATTVGRERATNPFVRG